MKNARQRMRIPNSTGLSARAVHQIDNLDFWLCGNRAGPIDLLRLANLSKAEFKHPGLGAGTLNEIERWLAGFGLKLRDQEDRWRKPPTYWAPDLVFVHVGRD